MDYKSWPLCKIIARFPKDEMPTTAIRIQRKWEVGTNKGWVLPIHPDYMKINTPWTYAYIEPGFLKQKIKQQLANNKQYQDNKHKTKQAPKQSPIKTVPPPAPPAPNPLLKRLDSKSFEYDLNYVATYITRFYLKEATAHKGLITKADATRWRLAREKAFEDNKQKALKALDTKIKENTTGSYEPTNKSLFKESSIFRTSP